MYPPEGFPTKQNKESGGIKVLTKDDYESVIPQQVFDEMAQLVKGNSIEGCKVQVDVCWTPFANLRKGPDMPTGTIGFHREQQVWHLKHVDRDREALKKLEKTRCERDVDLVKERAQREEEERARIRKHNQELKMREKEERKRAEEAKALKSYAALQTDDSLKQDNKSWGDGYQGTVEECREVEDDFM
mmetsp:Transcript_20658/g.45927  ORF Transcript_20658/g.45927 Transcript_20658/m.45927 type:complete len:188 (-) Transcript_20658:81-644(-)